MPGASLLVFLLLAPMVSLIDSLVVGLLDGKLRVFALLAVVSAKLLI
jgi:hypothetical protein